MWDTGGGCGKIEKQNENCSVMCTLQVPPLTGDVEVDADGVGGVEVLELLSAGRRCRWNAGRRSAVQHSTSL